MKISRREFLRFCTASSATLAFSTLDLLKLERALANPNGPRVLWLLFPTAFGGAPCWAWTENGTDVTFANAATSLASRAKAVLAVGTCAAWGGMSAAAPNPTGVKGVSAVIGKPTVNIAGCPPHPDWIVWGVAKALTGSVGTLDAHGRPTALFGRTVHDQCPREEASEATAYGQDNRCLKHLGCYGP
ncbi:MAG: periplasmic [NiFeSe] hydrogenase small subunit, partial [candidate division NC10 bacterium]|nr:periplasmic [NiFeSe] hydrogenase small subunit [candidate division NC10 bacterium]